MSERSERHSCRGLPPPRGIRQILVGALFLHPSSLSRADLYQDKHTPYTHLGYLGGMSHLSIENTYINRYVTYSPL